MAGPILHAGKERQEPHPVHGATDRLVLHAPAVVDRAAIKLRTALVGASAYIDHITVEGRSMSSRSRIEWLPGLDR